MIRSRPEWLDEPRVLPFADPEPVTLGNFAHSETADVLAVEPRLVALAELVRRARPTAAEWAGVDQLASLLVGPGRVARQLTPVNATSVAVTATLRGATTRDRYLQALRALVDVEPA